MATYIQGLTQYLPQIQPFQRDFNFYANVMQKKQTEYDAGHEQMNKLYGSIFYSDVSRDDMKERKDEILKAIDFNLKKVSALDVSLKQNVRQAQQVFRPFYEDKELMKDIVYTKTYQQQMQRGLSAKDCIGKDCPEIYWDGGVRLLEHQMNRFKKASLDEAVQMSNPSYTPYFNIMKEAQKIAKENKFEIVYEGPRNGYMVKEINGPNAVMPLHNFLLENFSNDPRAIDFYNAKAQLSFYDNPEKTINQYELLKLKQSAKDDEDYKRMLEEKSKQLEFNKSKNNIASAENKTKKEAAIAKDRRKVFQDYANEMGELFQASPARNDYEQALRDEETKSKTYNDLKDLNDQVKNINYFDSDGNPVKEHVITSVVAQGMLLEDSFGAAKSIAQSSYKQTVSGPDPYALARYKNGLARSLELYKSDLRLYEGAISGEGSSKSGKSKESGYLPEELTFEEEEKIRKQTEAELKKELGANISEADKDKAFEEAKAQELTRRYQNNVETYNQKAKALEKAAERGNFTQEQAQALSEILENDAQNLNKFKKDIMSISATEPTQSYSVQTDITQNPIDQYASILSMTEADPSTSTHIIDFSGDLTKKEQPNIVTSTDRETGKQTTHKLTGTDFKNIFTDLHTGNLSSLRQPIEQVDIALKNKGRDIYSKIIKSIHDSKTLEQSTGIESGKGAAIRNIIRGLGIDVDISDEKTLQKALSKLVKENPEDFANYFIGKKGSPMMMRMLEEGKGTLENPLSSELTVGAKSDVPYDVWTNKYQAKQIGLSEIDLIDIRINELIKRQNNTKLNSYLKDVKDAQQSQAETALLAAGKTELERINSLRGEYSLLKNPIKESYIKINNEYVKSTEPTTIKEAFNMTLQDLAINEPDLLNKLFYKAAYSQTSGTTMAYMAYMDVSQFKDFSKEDLANFDFKTLDLLEQAGHIIGIGTENNKIFQRDDYGNIKFSHDNEGTANTPLVLPNLKAIEGHKELLNLLPTDDDVTNAEFQRIQSTTRVSGHLHRGLYFGTKTDNDFGTAGFNLRNNFTINNVPKDVLLNSRDAITLGREQFSNNPYITHTAVSNKNAAVIQIQNANGEWVNASADEQERQLVNYENMFSKQMSEAASKLSVSDSPNITQTLIPYSELGTNYGIIEFKVLESGEGLQKTFKLVTPERKANFKKEDLDKKGIQEIKNIRIHVPVNEYQPFVQSRKNLAFTTMGVGDKLGDLKDFDSEVVVESVEGEKIKYNIKYNNYYIDYSEQEIKMEVLEKEQEYNLNSNSDYFELMKTFLIIGNNLTKESRERVKNELNQ
jgi:hypothetical protein